MANLTLTIDDDLLLRARQRALSHGTSVNALVREYLTSFAGEDETAEIGRALVELARKHSGSSGTKRTWTRDELYARHER